MSETAVRECGCDALGLLRCAHWEGQVVQFIQGFWDGKLQELWHICTPPVCVPIDGGSDFTGDYDQALAAFAEAEAAMLREP